MCGEPHATGLDRNEVGALLVAARLASARDDALISLLAINGLRGSEALGADIEALGIGRGHRTLTVVRKGGQTVIIPLAPRTARAVDLAIGERVEEPIFLATNGDRLDRNAAWRIALGSFRDRLGDHPVGQHPGTQPLSKELEHPPVRHPLADQAEQSLLVDFAEEVPDIPLSALRAGDIGRTTGGGAAAQPV